MRALLRLVAGGLSVVYAGHTHAQTLTATRGLFSPKEGMDATAKNDSLKDSVVVSIVADGNVRTVLTGKSSNAPTPVAGALGITFGRYNSNFTVLINVVGSADTVKREFGASLLPPTSGGSTSNKLGFLIDYRRLLSGTFGWGWHTYISGAPTTWLDTASANRPAYGAFIIAAGVQLSREVYNQDVAGTSVSVVFDVGPALRSIHGNLSSSSQDVRGARTRLLQSGKRGFVGAELGMTVQVKEVRLGVSYYQFGGGVPGLSRGQGVFGFSVANSFFAGRTKKVPPPVR